MLLKQKSSGFDGFVHKLFLTAQMDHSEVLCFEILVIQLYWFNGQCNRWPDFRNGVICVDMESGLGGGRTDI